MAGPLDDITAARSNVLQRLDAGEVVSPEERETLDQMAAGRQGEFRKGLRRAAYNASATTRGFLGGVTEPFAPNFANDQFARAERIARSQPADVAPAVDSFRKVNDLQSAVQYASGALGEGLTSVGSIIAGSLAARLGLSGAALATGTRASQGALRAAQFAGGAAAMVPQEGGETALTLRQNPEAMANTTALERAGLTLGKGAIAGAMESIVPNLVFTNAITGAAGRIAAGTRPALENIGRKATAGVVGEGATEFSQELAGQVAENIAAPGTGYDLERPMEAAVRGAITGGVLGGAGGTIQAVRSNIDTAAERAAEDVPRGTQAGLNAAVERIDAMIRNPEQFGADLTDTTMGALAEAAARTRQAGEAAGPAAASGMDAIAAMRQRFDRAVAGKLTPENRQKYLELTQNFRLLQPTEFDRLRNALDTGDATEINEAIGDVAFQLRDRVPNETLQGLKNLAEWGKKFGKGVTRAARERRAAFDSGLYNEDQIVDFRVFLQQQYPDVLKAIDNTPNDSNEFIKQLMVLSRSERGIDRELRAAFDMVTGADIGEVLARARDWTGSDIKPSEARELMETAIPSPTARIMDTMERTLTPELQEQFAEMGIEIGPGATEGEAGTVRLDGEIMDVERPTNTPFSSLNLVKRVIAADMYNGAPIRSDKRRFDPRFVIPGTLRSDTLSAAQIGQLLGGKDSYRREDGGYSARPVNVNEDTIAMRTTEDGGYRQDFNTIDIAAQAGKPWNEAEQDGFKENFAPFVPDFEGNARDIGIQAYRLLSSIAALDTYGIEIERSEIDPALLEQWGLDPEGDPIHIDVDMPVDSLGTETVVQRKGGRDVTVGDLTGANRAARSLPRQLDLLSTLGDTPNQQLQQLKNQPGMAGKTADALSRGLYNFAVRQEAAAGRDLTKLKAVEKRDTINRYAPAYAEYLRERIENTETKARDTRNINRLRNGLRDELFTPEQFRENLYVLRRAYLPEEWDAYLQEQRQLAEATTLEEMENVETADVDPEKRATEEEALAWADALEMEYGSTDDLVEIMERFEGDGLDQYEMEQRAYEPFAGEDQGVQEPTADDLFEAYRKDAAQRNPSLRQRDLQQPVARQPSAPARTTQQRPGETANARMIRERREAQATAEDNEVMRQEMDREAAQTVREETAAAAEGDGTLRRDTRKVADREKTSVSLRDNKKAEVTIDGSFTLFGEEFIIHRNIVNNKHYVVAHKNSGLAVAVTNESSISGAHKVGLEKLQRVGRSQLIKTLRDAGQQTQEEIDRSEREWQQELRQREAEQEALAELPEALRAQNEDIAATLREEGYKPPLGAFEQRLVDGTEFVGEKTLLARTVRNWANKYLDGAEVRVVEYDPRDPDVQAYFGGGKPPLGRALRAGSFDSDMPATILLQRSTSQRGGRRYSRMHTLAHEFGHIIDHTAFENAPAEVKAGIDRAYQRLVQDLVGAGNTDEAMFNAGSVRRFIRDREANTVLERDVPYEENAALIAEGIRARQERGDTDYILSKQEFFAEQFAKYAMGDPNIFAGESKSVRDYLDRVLQKVKAFYQGVVRQLDKTAPEFDTFMKWLGTPAAERPPFPDYDPVQWDEQQAPAPERLENETNAEYVRRMRGQQEQEPAPNEPTEPPQEPPSEPPDGQQPPPPPPPDDSARQRFEATVKRLLGDRVKVKFGVDDLPDGVAAEYVNRFGQTLEDTGKALSAAAEQRREEIRALKRRRGATQQDIDDGKVDPRTPEEIEESIRSLEDQMEKYRSDLAVRGTIRVAQGMEAQAGVAEHEAFHAAFEIFFGDNNAADRKAVTTAFTRGVLANRLRKYFAGNAEVLSVIDPTSENFKAEEAAAYGFQVFLHDPQALQMGQKVEGIFNRFLAFLQGLVGYKTYEERARTIFNDLNSGKRSERGTSVLRDNPRVERSMLDRSQEFVREVGTGFMHMYDSVFTSTYSRLERSGNAAMAQIARLGYNETGQEGNGMIQRQRHMTTQWSNRMKDALHTLSEEELSQLNDAMLLGDKLTGKLGQAQQRLRQLLDDVLKYQNDAGAVVYYKENYYPMIWDPDKVAADYQGFIDLLNEYPAQLQEMMKTPDEIFESIVSFEERGHEFQGIFGKDGEPVADSSRRRTLDFIDKEGRRKYMSDDLVETMAHYLNQSVRHAEYVRAYGQNGSRLKQLMGEIRGVYGGSDHDVRLAKDYVDGLMGNKEVGMSRELKDLYGAATVYQNVRLLPLSVFSSLVDPLGVAVRTNNMGAAFDTFAYSVRNMFTDFRSQTDWTPDQWEQYAADMGTIDMSGTVKSIDKIYTGVTLRGKTRAINDGFFKWNLLNGWVKNNHIAATKAAQLFLRRSAEGMFGEERSAQNLQEVGVRPEDIVYDEALGRIRSTVPEILGYADMDAVREQADPDDITAATEQADRIQQAIHKIVRQSLIQPSSAEMPGWMSNPYLAPIAHLKTFVFGFNKTILQRLAYEAGRGNYNPIYYAAAYVPGMIAADFIKGFAGNGGEEPEWKKNWGVSDYVGYGVHRSGLTGTAQFFTDMNNDVTRGGGGWESLAGPTIEQGQDLLQAMNAKTSQPTQTWMLNALPANDLYDQWLREY